MDHWRYKTAYPYCDIPILFIMSGCRVKVGFTNFAQNRLPWHRPLRNRKNWSRLITLTQIPFTGKKIMKIGPVYAEIP